MDYVLVVDDDTAIMANVAQVLREEGHKVMVAENGRTAMRQIDNNPGRFAGLITDQQMPHGLNGADVIMYMRDSYPTIPMILITGNPATVTGEWLERFRVHLLVKPFTFTVMLAVLAGPLPRGVAG